MGHRLPSQGPTARAVGVKAGSRVKDDGSTMVIGCCLRIIDKSFFPSLEQARLGAPESRLLASSYSIASLSH